MEIEGPGEESRFAIAFPDWFRQIVDQLPSPVMVCDPADLRVLYANAVAVGAVARIGGAPEDSIVGARIFDIFPGTSSLGPIRTDTGGGWYSTSIRAGGGRFDFRILPIRDEHGQCIALNCAWSEPVEIQVAAEAESNILRLRPRTFVAHGSAGSMEIGISDDTLDRLEESACKLRQVSRLIRELHDAVHPRAAEASAEANDAGRGIGKPDQSFGKITSNLSVRIRLLQNQVRELNAEMQAAD